MSDPLHTPTMLLKNTLNIKTPGGDTTPGEKTTRYFPRKLLQDIENDPPTSMISPSKYAVVRQLVNSKLRGPLEDHDTNSQDSGISDDSKSCSEFRFAEPCGAAPKRMSSIEMSPLRIRSPRTNTPDRAGLSPRVRRRLPEASPKRSLIFSTDSALSLSSFSSESNDDGFLDLFQNDKLMDEDDQMSGSRLGNLLSAQILTNSPPRSPARRNVPFQRSLSENVSPNKSDVFTLKRPLLLSSHSVDATTPVSKKHKPLGAQDLNVVPPHDRGTLFQYGFKRSPASVLSSSGLLSPPHSITPEPTSPPRFSTPSSSSEHSIKLGFQRSTTEELIGDFSRPFALPLSAKDHDLKIISSETLAKLIQGEFEDHISSFKIIDCRYPYEYDGGHIKGAVNLYRKDQIMQELHKQRDIAAKLLNKRAKQKAKLSEEQSQRIESCSLIKQISCDDIETLAVSLSDSEELTRETVKTSFLIENSNRNVCLSPQGSASSSPSKDSLTAENDNGNERHILVFHCEYSSERGPGLYRCLRQEDRADNPYPQLTYPELYLLGGGYNSFYSSHSDLCEPRAYKPMTHPDHAQDLRNFRAKSKSWAGKHNKKLSVRNLSRLGF